MNKKSIYLICSFLFFCSCGAFGQNLVAVNPLTGSANVVIPIYTVNWGQVSLPISISYNTQGVKPKDVEGTAGMNWQLNAGGQISRSVKGLPDDCSKDNAGNARLGWMSTSNTSASYISSFVPQNNGTTCSYGATDVSNINANTSVNHDTEPDIFYVNAPGLSCQMVYDHGTASFHPMNYQDLIISYTVRGGTGYNATNIVSFSITNDKGTKYVFAAPDSIIEKTTSVAVSYFNKKYTQYQNGITYSGTWYLTSMTDVNGNGISLDYGATSVRNSTDPIELFLNNSLTATVQYNDLQTVVSKELSDINTFNSLGAVINNYFTFNWTVPVITYTTGKSFINMITGMGRTLRFSYQSLYSTTGTGSYTRAFLTGFDDLGCGSPISYKFGYAGTDLTMSSTVLADSSSKQIDYWGYYSSSASSSTLLPSVYVNPSTGTYPRYALNVTSSPGSAYSYTLGSNSRAVTASSITAGALNSITNALGGTTTISYEPNDYYDVPSGSVVQGGGIRVSQVVESTGNSSGNDITTNYTYLNPTGTTNAGLSSGTPVSLPQFAFTVPYTGSYTGLALWQQATALSATDLSDDDRSILYAYSKVSRTGAGSTLYNYTVPVTYWNASATPSCSGCTTAEWYPTVDDAASYNCPSTNGPIANLSYSYPFIPNPNYDFERGLPLSIISFNESGNKVAKTSYTYQRSYTPTKITAFKSEDGPVGSVAKFYNTYAIYYGTSELPYTLTKKVYDSNNAGAAQTNTTTYTYGSGNHKLLTQQSVTNSDNSTLNSYFSYVKDFATTSGASDPNFNALYNLKTLNVNAGVESYQTVTRGSTTVTTGANLTLFSPSVNGAITHYLPSQQLKMLQPNGAAFTPFTINAGAQTVAWDSNYLPTANYQIFDPTGYPVTVDDNYKHVQTSFFDQLSNHPTIFFKNALYNEVASNDFDSQIVGPRIAFTILGTGSYYPVGSHNGNAAGIAATTQSVRARFVNKNPAAQNYIFSIWINAVNAGTLTFTGSSASPTLSYAAGGWTYYELKIPASSLSSTFTLSFTSDQNISIDDVLLYPDVAEATTVAYDSYQHYKIGETNTNGVSTYYVNDTWGRLSLVLDQDKNIVARKQYATPASYQTFLAPTIDLVNPDVAVYAGTSASFVNSTINTCFSDLTYTWDFGDGSALYSTGFSHGAAHTYALSSTYTVTVTVSSPLLGKKTGTYVVTIL